MVWGKWEIWMCLLEALIVAVAEMTGFFFCGSFVIKKISAMQSLRFLTISSPLRLESDGLHYGYCCTTQNKTKTNTTYSLKIVR